MSDKYMTTGEKIKACRYFTNEMSQRELARLVGIAQPTLSNIEQGLSEPNDEARQAMEKVFGVELKTEVFVQDFVLQLINRKEDQPIAA